MPESFDKKASSLRKKLRNVEKEILFIHGEGKRAIDDRSNVNAFKGAFRILEKYYRQYEEIWDILVDMHDDEGKADRFPNDPDLATRRQVRSAFYETNTFYEIIMSPVENTKLLTPGRGNNLPVINLPEFCGDVTQWPRFKDTFVSLVHSDTTLTNTQKFHYLLAAIKGSASSHISHLPITDTNYALAWSTLCKNYDDKRVLAAAYLNNVLNFKVMSGKPTIESLRNYISRVIDNVAAFKLLELDDDSDFILLHLALKGLDTATRQQFEIVCKDTDLPTVGDLAKFIRDHCRALQMSDNSPCNFEKRKFTESDPFKHRQSRRKVVLSANSHTSQKLPPCFACKKECLSLSKCPKFLSLTVEARQSLLQNWRGCKNCLSSQHKTYSCTSKFNCRVCARRHHSLLHFENQAHGIPSAPTVPPVSTEGTSLNSTSPKTVLQQVLLGTALALIRDARGQYQQIRLVVDSGSQFSFITHQCLNRLGLTMLSIKPKVSGIGKTAFEGAKGIVDCTLKSKVHTKSLQTSAVVVKTITALLPCSPVNISIVKRFQEFSLADPDFWKPAPVDFLLGADLFPEIWINSQLPSNDSSPSLFNTIFGYLVVGKVSSIECLPSLISLCSFPEDESELNTTLKRFWEIEEIPSSVKIVSPEDEECERQFVNSYRRAPSGQYIVRLPFKATPPIYENIEKAAMSRFLYLETSLRKNRELGHLYCEFMTEYHRLGHMEEATRPAKFILPHHGVLKQDRDTRKLRVVFNASAKFHQSSLNDFLYPGPKLQKDISHILMNFRAHRVVFITDVIKMYRYILVDPEDRPYQNIFWRSCPDKEVTRFELSTVTYGMSAAPYLALRVMQQLANDYEQDYPLGSDVLKRFMYVDDVVTGADSFEEAAKVRDETIEILRKGGFSLSKWASNTPNLVPYEDKSQTIVSFGLKEDNSLKVLGLMWDSSDDAFSYRISLPAIPPTKRSILSAVARLYDPLGLLSPVTFLMKSLIQDIWKEGLDWDETVSEDVKTRWETLCSQFHLLSSLRIPRWTSLGKNAIHRLVGFADASGKGYCAALYLHCTMNDNIKISLISAKTKLAPIKPTSIPRLELCAAVLLAKLLRSTISSFILYDPNFKPILFSDSSTTLCWIKTPPHRLKPFVANRVAKIVEITPTSVWRHVPSSFNPSDAGSRGLMPSQLLHHTQWWQGPEWLALPEDQWPADLPTKNENIPELKTSDPIVLAISVADQHFLDWCKNYSSFSKFINVIAYIRRFCHNAQRKAPNLTGELSLAEIKDAVISSCRQIQSLHFFKDCPAPSVSALKSFKSLSPFIDSSGVVRVGGRLKHSDLSYDQKYPILLPSKSHFTNLVIDHFHLLYQHPGPNLQQALIQSKFWIPGARRVIRTRSFLCMKCYRARGRTSSPKMGDLPAYRVKKCRAFLQVGVDFAGPFIMRESLRRKAATSKLYLCLFVCMSTKALHLEPVTRLSTEAFIATFTRFTARRGLPLHVYSDCGTNFQGAARHLGELYSWLKQSDTQAAICRHAMQHEVEWHFNPPLAPHFGGLWEAGVKSVKGYLLKIAGDTPLTYEEWATLFSKVEAVLNSRPLCPLSSSPEEYEYLSPGHFLVGGPLLSTPDPSLLCEKESLLTRWQLVRSMAQQFWQRWQREYLCTLQQRPKWKKEEPSLKEGDLVLLKQKDVPFMKWPMSRIIETHPGSDRIVRVVTIKTPTSILKRPVHTLVPLRPLDENPYPTH